MGLDWFTSGNEEYKGPKYHRANGLKWVLRECGYNESADKCYGEDEPGEQLCILSDTQMQDILKDIRTLIEKQEFPESILENIEIDDLNKHLKEAEQMLDMVIAFKGDVGVSIYADY